MTKTVTVNDIVLLLQEIAPPQLAEEWDNVGLMLGRRNKPVHKILLALDMTAETVAQAIDCKADLLVTHHPAIFKRLSSLTDGSWQQELLLQLAEHGIAVYSAHTNLDAVAGGVNDCLARHLGLEDADVLDNTQGLVRVGCLPKPCSLNEFAEHVKKVLHADYVVIGDAKRTVHKVALCGGAGSDFIDAALANNVDTFVTGDVKYHEAQRAVFSGMNLLDAGHQCTEWPVLDDLADRLSLRFTDKNWNIILKVAKETLLLKHL